MDKKKIDGVIDGLDDQIIGIVGEFINRRKKTYEDAAVRLKNALRDDVQNYAELLADKKIKTDDFEHLVRGRTAQLKIELLEEVSVSAAKFDLVTEQVLKTLLKGVIMVVAAL